MEQLAKATRIRLLDFVSVPMGTFHVTWMAFFVCFFAWFGIAPLMAIVRKEMQLTDAIFPFVNPRSVGSVAGIVGAGGNLGAVFSGFLFKGTITWPTALLLLGAGVTVVSVLAWLVRLTPEAGAYARQRPPATNPIPEPALSPAA